MATCRRLIIVVAIENSIRRNVAIELCRRALKLSIPTDHSKLFDAYMQSHRAGTSLEPTETGPGDDYCLLCAHSLIDAHETTGDVSHLYEAIIALETSLEVRFFHLDIAPGIK
jgi:hypothetical protein